MKRSPHVPRLLATSPKHFMGMHVHFMGMHVPELRPSVGNLAHAARGLFTIAAMIAAIGCGPRVTLEPVVETEDFRVGLRRTIQAGEPQSRSYTHPTTIADVRLAHVLANLEYENAEGRRAPAIRAVHVYPLAEALNQAITQATPADEVVAAVFSGDRRLGIFTTRKVTSFRLFFQDDVLRIEFFDIERALEPGEGKPGRSDAYRIPEATPDAAPSFRVLKGEAHVADGRRAVDVAWRDPYFAQPVSLSVRGDRFKRRTVLMESESSENVARSGAATEALPPGLGDAQISALDQLEALRRQGLIKEAEYQRRRRLILDGNLEEAGYTPGAP